MNHSTSLVHKIIINSSVLPFTLVLVDVAFIIVQVHTVDSVQSTKYVEIYRRDADKRQTTDNEQRDRGEIDGERDLAFDLTFQNHDNTQQQTTPGLPPVDCRFAGKVR